MDPFAQGLKERHRFADYLYWNLIASVPLVTAAVAISASSLAGLLFYLAAMVALLVLIARFFCTRCPHYLADQRRLHCMFYWGIPKFFAPRPGSLTFWDKLITFLAAALVILLPLPWLRNSLGLLVIYLLSASAFALTIRRYECTRCIYDSCPANCVSRAASDD